MFGSDQFVGARRCEQDQAGTPATRKKELAVTSDGVQRAVGMASDSTSARGSFELMRLPVLLFVSRFHLLFFIHLGDGASGANFVVTSHALKMSETVKQHNTQHTTHNTQPTKHDQTRPNTTKHDQTQTNTNKHKQTQTNTNKHKQTRPNTNKHDQTRPNTNKHRQTRPNTTEHTHTHNNHTQGFKHTRFPCVSNLFW